MKPLFKQNVPIDERRISLIETVVSRFARRSRKVVSALVTPYPISSASFGDNVTGSVLRYMFPYKGTITKGLIYFGSKLKSGVRLFVSISSDTREDSKEFVISEKTTSIELNIEVGSGHRLTMSVEPNNSEEKITEVWISFSWVPAMKDAEVKSFLIDELDGNTEEDYSA